MSILGVSRPGFLILPAILTAVFVILACLYLVPHPKGVLIASAVYLALASYFSFLHRELDGELSLHIVWWGVVLGASWFFACRMVPEIVPSVLEVANLAWWQAGFVVLQQVLYFGVHAFSKGE